MKPHVLLRVIAFMLLPFLLSGCWDRVEIQDRLFVMAVAIDKNKGEKGKRSYYEFTAQFTEARALSGRVTSPHVSPVWNATSTGPSIFECIRLMATRVARVPYYEHLQVIIIGEELAKEGLNHPLDLFLRDHESRRKIKLVIVQGSAKEALYVKPKLIPVSGQYISRLTEQGRAKTARLPHTTSIGQFSSNFHGGTNSVLPRITTHPHELKMAGGAIMKGEKLVGWLTDQEVKSLRWINGTFSAGDEVLLQNPEGGPPGFTTLEVKAVRSTVHTAIKNGKPVFTVMIRGESNLAEDGMQDKPTIEKLKKKEEQVNKTVQAKTEALIKKMQSNIQTDIFGFGEELRRHQYAYWKTHEKNWEHIFKEAEVHVNVETFIRRIGQFK
ncbi:Ger(x)C family spore germination protein [Brevibacillus choshinensis]|uniref:Ger(x)C family spore germination protein n=1 Tax=Brevibacillus choshinensis TaxID=54911 RepID=UPI002E1CD19B|nr:Ger(x)C family spore germination protein [Brevibacillus choshinensis]